MKNLKHVKKAKTTVLVEQVMLDLQLQLNMHQSEEQQTERRDMINARIKDLEDRTYLKLVGEEVEYVPV